MHRSGFRTHGLSVGCSQSFESCLKNQIIHLIWEDQDEIAAGREPRYHITKYGGGPANTRQAARSGSGLALRLPVKGIRTSVVTLEVAADAVDLVVNRAPGKIMSAEVCTFDDASCGGFQAIATRGYLRVALQNTGPVAAEFRVGALDCGEGIVPVLEQYAAIAPGMVHNFTLEVFMETDTAGNRTCTVVATDSQGDLADSKVVDFYTEATEYEPPPEQPNDDGKVSGAKM
jgi:hypothetical protein